MFVTEKATRAADLPHRFVQTQRGNCGVCNCSVNNVLHASVQLEKAAESIDLITEKGI